MNEGRRTDGVIVSATPRFRDRVDVPMRFSFAVIFLMMACRMIRTSNTLAQSTLRRSQKSKTFTGSGDWCWLLASHEPSFAYLQPMLRQTTWT